MITKDSYGLNAIMVFATYKPFQSLVTDVPWLVETALANLLKPLKVPVVDSVITCIRLDDRWTPNRKFNAHNWKRVKADLAWGNMAGFLGIWVIEKGEHVLLDQDFEISILGPSNQWPTLIAIALSKSVIGNGPANSWQDHWVTLGHEIFRRFDCATGYLTIDNEQVSNFITPYELERHMAFPGDLTQLLRGYYWGNWLSSGHVQRLGGVASIQVESPCFQVVQLAECEGLFLQLTPNLDDYSDAALRKLRFYLGELLPQYNQPLIWNSNTTKYRLAYDGERAGWKGQLILYDVPH